MQDIGRVIVRCLRQNQRIGIVISLRQDQRIVWLRLSRVVRFGVSGSGVQFIFVHACYFGGFFAARKPLSYGKPASIMPSLGDVAKWQGKALQKPDHRFESGRRLSGYPMRCRFL